MHKIAVMAIASLVMGALTYHYQPKFSYSDFKDYCNTLLAISGMVFTIMGIWIAFIYPNAIKRLQDPDKIKIADFSSTLRDTRRLESIVGSVMEAGFVALCITLIYFAKLAITGFAGYESVRLPIRAMASGFIVFLTLIQCSSIASVIYANYLFIDDLHGRRESQERDNDI